MGIILFFFSNDHEPIRVRGQKREFESKANFMIENGEIIVIQFINVKGKEPLKDKDLLNFKIFVRKYHFQIFHKWKDYFEEKKKVTFEVIKRIK